MGTESSGSVLNAKSEIKAESEDLTDSCRLCMEQSNNMKNIFSAEHSQIVERVEYCTGLQLVNEDGLPSHACDLCITNLTIAYKFKAMCLTSDERYRGVVPKIKTEQPEVEVDGHFDDIDDGNDCKNILREVLKLSDIKISKVNLKKENIGIDAKPRRKSKIDSNPSLTPNKSRVNKKPPTRMKKMKYTKLHCDVCDLSFSSKEESLEHRKTVHKESESFVCEICGKVMLHRASLYTHVQSHLPPRHACDSCDYKTWHKHDLVKHRRIHTGIKLFQCEFCTSSYHTSSNLRCHIRLHHEGAPKRFPCRLCDRSFYDRTKLRRHLDAHNDIKRYACDVCHSCFTRRCYWKKHMARQHGVLVPAARPGPQKANLLVEPPA